MLVGLKYQECYFQEETISKWFIFRKNIFFPPFSKDPAYKYTNMNMCSGVWNIHMFFYFVFMNFPCKDGPAVYS